MRITNANWYVLARGLLHFADVVSLFCCSHKCNLTSTLASFVARARCHILLNFKYRQLWFFLALYAVFLAVIFLNVSVSEVFFARDALRSGVIGREMFESDAPNIRKDFNDVGQVSEAWQWLQGPFVETVSQVAADKQGIVLDFNQLIGKVRLRQLRTRNDSCALSEQLNNAANAGQKKKIDFT